MLEMNERQCLGCGVIFQVNAITQQQKYCTPKCRNWHYYARSLRKIELTEAQLQGESCLNCGAEITLKRGSGTPKMFCSHRCCDHFRYDTSPEDRAEIKERLREAAENHPRRKTRICRCCGKAFAGRKNQTYCSQDCNHISHSYAYNENQATAKEIRLTPRSPARPEVVEMHVAGMSAAEIANATGCQPASVRNWLVVYDRWQNTPPQHRSSSEPYFRYIRARNAGEWLAVLNDEMRSTPGYVYTEEETRNPSVVLVCGTILGQTTLHARVEMIESVLGYDPYNGNVYVFCNETRKFLRFLHWDGAGFQLTRRERDYGRYVWPSKKLGGAIAITPAEFAFLLYESQQKTFIENPWHS